MWRQKDEAWDKITNHFNSQTTVYARTKESLRKFYDNLKKNLRKDVTEDKRKTFKTGGGSREIEKDPTRNLLLDIVNQKSLFALDTPFGGDYVNQEEIHEIDIPDIESDADKHPIADHSYVIEPLSMEASSCMVTDKLVKVKRDLFTREKESFVKKERREEELFDLKKRKLQLDIRLTEMELSAKTVTKLSDT
nr:unnamed protein product [Callosobruchus chinensis]